ncbi:MAG: Fic family protein [Erysipelotrichaceae bacterium]|nr:Fic family protein [Erysipelotrichaceae bacterium]
MSNLIGVKETSIKWNISERSVRNYCALGRVEGAVLVGKTWFIPQDAKKPTRSNEKESKNHLLDRLRQEKNHQIKGGIYHKLIVDLTFNSNHIEGSKLSHDETRYIFETRTIGVAESTSKNVDDIVETINHFAAVDQVIDSANYPLSESFIKRLHGILKANTNDSRLPHFAVGAYKRMPNEVGGRETTPPRLVAGEMGRLLADYNQKEAHTFEDIVEFHVKFERIHPFQDGNGRVGRLIALKECLANNIVPFIILDDKKAFYYRGLKEWDRERGYLLDTCRDGQDIVKTYLDYFGISHK